MEQFSSILHSVASSIEGFFTSIDFSQHPYYVLDILIVALTFYYLYLLLRGTRAIPILTGLVILALVSFLSQQFKFSALSWLLGHFFTLIIIAIPVVFHDEIRRGLETIGQKSFFRPKLETRGVRKVVHALVEAAEAFSGSKTGALIVLKREVNLGEVIETGIPLNADVSAELLRTIFHPGSALHDGAVIIEGDKIRAGSCVLPLSLKTRQGTLGTRHKAGLGISEHTDAVAIIVSEERGKISIANNGILTQDVSTKELEQILSKILAPESKLPKLSTVLHKAKRKA